MSYGFADVLDDGRTVIAQFGVPSIQFGGNTATGGSSTVQLRTWLSFTRAYLFPQGLAWAVGKGNSNGHAYLVGEDGRTRDLGPTAGNQCVAINMSPNGQLVVAVQTSPTSADVYWIDSITLQGGIGQQHKFGQTSQGFADVGPDGTLYLTDPIFRPLAGHTVGFPCSRPAQGVTVAQSLVTGCVIARGNQIGNLTTGDCFEPHLSTNGQFWVCRSTSTVLSGPVPAVIPPLFSASTPAPDPPKSAPVVVSSAPTPKPSPQPPSQETDVLIDLSTIVEAVLTDVTPVPHPDGQGLEAFKTADGFKSLTPGGTWDVDKPVAGAWERFYKDGSIYWAYREDSNRYFYIGPLVPKIPYAK